MAQIVPFPLDKVRKSKNDNLVLLGQINEYEPLSRAAYHKATAEKKNKRISDTKAVSIDDSKKNSNV